jgi:hypothetical protein
MAEPARLAVPPSFPSNDPPCFNLHHGEEVAAGLAVGVGVGVGVGDLSGFGLGEPDGVIEGRGSVGDGEGPFGEGEGVAKGEAVGDGEARCGVANGVAGRLAKAFCMNRRHILAGNDPPTTAIPRTLVIALLLLA